MKSLRTRCHFYFIALAGLALVAGAQANEADLMSKEMCKDTLPHVAKAYAGFLAPIQHKGYCLAGDFNGDGKPDILMVVKVLVDKVPASSGIKTLYPFYDRQGSKGRLQFLALHSTPGSAKDDASRYEPLLLDGGSPIQLLHHEDVDTGMDRVTQRSSAVKGLQVPRRAIRGDGVLLGTEAVEAILYWNGTTYVLHEDPSGD